VIFIPVGIEKANFCNTIGDAPKMVAFQKNIESIIYFEGITKDEFRYIVANSTLYSLSAGEIIFLEGEPADGLWIVESGNVKIFKLNPDGAEHILHLRGPGTTFNDIAALDNGQNPASAMALSPEVRVWLIPTSVIHDVLTQNLQVALNVIRLLATRVRSLVGQIEDLALYSVIVRLARFLLRQSEDPSLSGPGVTRTAIAAHINTTPQTISNVLHTLEEMGAIQFNRHRIVIVNERILRSIAMQ
jgi:CRP-like cAMP-binding protein